MVRPFAGQALRRLAMSLLPDEERVILHPADVKILEALAQAITTLDQYALEVKTGLSRKTLSPRLMRLRKLGLTMRPNGERGGEAITPQGRALITH